MRSPLATLLSLPWGGLMALRRRAYGAGVLPSRKASLPVVSVGNLSLGGTGKSPLLLHLLHHLEAGTRHGLEELLPALPAPVAVLSRGYGRNSRGWRLVSQGDGPLLDVDEAGDEPFMIAKRSPHAWVAVSEDRGEGARRLAELGAGSILLDDGFQHLALRRNSDLLLWDCAVDPEREAVLPFGRLREDPRAALSASALLFTRPSRDLVTSRLEAFRAWFGRAGRELPPLRVVESSVAGLADPEDGRRTAAAGLGRHGVFCGIASPERFLGQAERLLGPPAWTRCWGDHHAFTDGDLDSLRRAVAEHRLRVLVTTWKDAVRLPAGHGLPLRVAEQELRIQGVETYLAGHA